MKSLLSFLKLSFLPQSTDLGLLVLRLSTGVMMLALHGLPKVLDFSAKSAGFPDPLGVGPGVSLSLAILAEFIGSILIILGLFTRGAALLGISTMAVAALIVSPGEELPLLYLFAYIALLAAGGGRFALDPHVK